MTKRKFAGAAIAGVVLATIAAPAYALYYTHSDMGAKTTVSANTVWLSDTADDGKFVSVEYQMGNLSHSLVNKSGFGTTVSASDWTNITNSRNCRSRWLLPMQCGAWKY